MKYLTPIYILEQEQQHQFYKINTNNQSYNLYYI